jgi:hypothetical protein
MIWRQLLVSLVLLSGLARAQSPKETDWEPALVHGGAPECSEHAGNRTSYSATARMGSITASIIGTANRGSDKSCSRNAELVLSGGVEKKIPLPVLHRAESEIADFSPDGRTLLLVSNKDLEPPHLETRDIELGVVDVNHPQIHLINAWDIFEWGSCEATVEPQGFTSDGRVLLRARPGTHYSETRHDCVPDWGSTPPT